MPGAQLNVSGSAARKALARELQQHAPAKWQWIADDRAADDSSKTRARVSQRDIEPSDTGDRRRRWVTFAVTVTVPSLDGIAKAEDDLDDELDAFLEACSAAGVPWTKASKGKFEDEGNRWGYQVDIRIPTNRKAA